ncbi:hypothetical protein [Novacetimonas pomaceti]|uniref:hypothetical protein n=1 Tax=Novacetimonas pomaceti TaxID=2021998 RepID=UPI001EEF9DDD|nr:hypothetical protein [Novacetimonas pomaceti]
MNKLVPLLGGMALLAGCAASPKDVQPTYVPDSAYSSLSCQQLGEAELKEGDVLQTLTDKQHRAHKTDTWGVLMVGLPLSEMTGSDVKGLLAREKGKMEALHRVQMAKGCAGTTGTGTMGTGTAGTGFPGYGSGVSTGYGTTGYGTTGYGTGAGTGAYGGGAYGAGSSSTGSSSTGGMINDPGGIGTTTTPASNLPGAADFRH